MKYCMIPFAAVVVLMSACQKNESVAYLEDQSGTTLTIHASVADDTRTYFEKDGNVYHPFWNATDAINVVYPGDWSKRSSFTNTQADGQDAVFSGVFSKKLEPGTYTLCAYYPSSATVSNSGGGLYKFTVKASQTIPRLGTFDPGADLLIAQPTPLVLEEELSTSTNKSVEMRFRRAVAVAKVTFTDNTTVSEKSLASHHITDFSLTYNTSSIIAGKIGVKMDDMQTADNYETSSKSVSVHYDGNDFKADGSCSAYVIVSPAKLSKNKKLLINVVTEDNALAISKEITLPNDIEFIAGKVVPLRISLTDDNVTVLNLSPEFTAPDVEIEATETSGTIGFSVANRVEGATVYMSVTSSNLSNVSWGSVSYDATTGAGSIGFTCDSNTDVNNLRTASVHLAYKTGAESEELASADVTVTQKKAMPSGSTVYYYYFDKDAANAVVNTSSYFAASSGTFVFSSSDCGADSFTVEGIECTQGVKLNKDGFVSFTTSASATSIVTFYYACRKSGDNSSARIKITPTNPSGDAVVYGGFNTYGTVSSQTKTLDASTTYSIQRDNKELALVMVKVVETPL